MIFPIGHERSAVRRLPYVSLAIVALNFAVFLFTYLREGSPDPRPVMHKIQAALEYLEMHPYLELPRDFVDTVFKDDDEQREAIEGLRAARGPGGREQKSVLADQEQRHLDDLCHDALAAIERLKDNYGRRLGFIPAVRRPLTLFTHQFVHGGWGHLIGNLIFFYLAGPFLEDVYGRLLFPVFYLLSGVAAAYVEAAHAPESTVPLIGASGAIAGCMGAWLMRFTHTRIRFVYWFALFFRGTFWAPAWLMLPMWLLLQLVQANLMGESAGVAFWAHVGGFLFGAGFAAVVRYGKVEERWIAPRIDPEGELHAPPGLEAGLTALREGDARRARQHLQDALRKAPNDSDVHFALYRTAVALGDAAAAGRHAVRHVDLELRAKRLEAARAGFLDAAAVDPPPPWPASQLHALGRAAERLGDFGGALETYGLLVVRHPRDPATARGLAAAASIYARHGQYEQAVEQLRRALHVPGLDAEFAIRLEAELRAAAEKGGLPVPEVPKVLAKGLPPPVAGPPPARPRPGKP